MTGNARALDAELDVVIVGGGLQGLLALETLSERGYAVALVSDGDLGEGQTLHSHGFFNTGFGMLGPALPDAARDVVQPYLRAHAVESTGDWRVVLPPGFPGADAMPRAALPAGFATPFAADAVASPDRSFPKRRLVEAISRGRLDRVLRGRARLGERAGAMRTVSVDATAGEQVRLTARAVVVAAGCGTKRLLEESVGRTEQTAAIKHRRVHMICLRAPRGALPATSVMVMPLALMLAAHEEDDHVTWYVTPMEFGGTAFDHVPNAADSDVDATAIARGFQALRQLFPGVVEAVGATAGAYAGYRQDIGDTPGVAMCEPLAGAGDVIVALPSGLVAPWLNAQRVADLVAERTTPTARDVPIPAGGVGVRVAEAVEDRPGFVWRPVGEFARSNA